MPASRYGEATGITRRGTGSEEAPQHLSAAVGKLVDTIPHDFALATQTVFYVMAGVMAVAFVVALVAMPSGRVEEVVKEPGGGAR